MRGGSTTRWSSFTLSRPAVPYLMLNKGSSLVMSQICPQVSEKVSFFVTQNKRGGGQHAFDRATRTLPHLAPLLTWVILIHPCSYVPNPQLLLTLSFGLQAICSAFVEAFWSDRFLFITILKHLIHSFILFLVHSLKRTIT